MREILEQTRYRIIGAADGEHALKELQKHCDAAHLLITDIIMPKMDGLIVESKRPGQSNPDSNSFSLAGITTKSWIPKEAAVRKNITSPNPLRQDSF